MQKAARLTLRPAHLAAALLVGAALFVAARPVSAAELEAPFMVAAATAKKCSTCGTVQDVRVVEEEGKGSGLGAVAGGVAGALVGSQIGQGTGNTVATIAGAAGGAYAGHQVEKKVKATKHYEITVKMDNGKTLVFTQENDPGLSVGAKVKVVDGRVVLR